MTGLGIKDLYAQIQRKPITIERTLEGVDSIMIEDLNYYHSYGVPIEIVETTGSPKITLYGDMVGFDFNEFNENDVLNVDITNNTAFIDINSFLDINWGKKYNNSIYFFNDLIDIDVLTDSKVVLEIPRTGLNKLHVSGYSANVNVNNLDINDLKLDCNDNITFSGEGEIENLVLIAAEGYIDFKNNIIGDANIENTAGYLNLDGKYKNIDLSYDRRSEITINSTEPYTANIEAGFSNVNVYGEVDVVDINRCDSVVIKPSSAPQLITIVDTTDVDATIIFPEDIEGFIAKTESYDPWDTNIITSFDVKHSVNSEPNLYTNEISYGNEETKIHIFTDANGMLKILKGE
ncbi:hypothetical protein AN639_12445 [Candidatus Epulonipiscium fishelsonii]|uniref:Uncharacterized protein n=1 Tax=Candidatus Epulonipiscium fishelsonii TaxID=77094 RepID=A0ACC8XCE5_9FIRM|nr:hypothetical protein AN396_01215 [Epulopiscium sp. SCG-B11WGA-EpuloA1]ONI42463.1 hypothetical protein AN639_12445 [Epulopiscium sp. SCG-B05WGA-EpuloA1]